MATSFERTDNVVAKKELEMDKLALQMIDLACKADRTQKALDLTAMLCNLRYIDAAVKIAHHHSLHSLMERMNKVKEIKMMEEQDKDPNAEMELIMADPVLAVPTAKDQSAYKVSSREEEQELERKAIQRKEPVKPNDPFGRRVARESNSSSRAVNGQKSTGSGGAAGAAAVSPFKKKSGSDPTGPKGFGSVVKESDKNILPITRRATDIFEAADYLVADEHRARTEKEKQPRQQEDSFRKRKAKGVPTSNGGQKTLNMFSKSAAAAASSSTSVDAKRFKKQPNEDVDMAMDADEMLEEDVGPAEDSEGEDEDESASVVVPATQAEDQLAESIEETRDHLEKTCVEPPEPSSVLLAGFKFNRSSS
ncbi:hypothetical protein BGZ65_005497 [Modicella reniformis]|uniref:WDHD1/CFT4 helical bundle domain-containing protein n=1 Tax=Modicella reniformis TaxID=1440133 RepID=A0A9P6IK53_9FUNG|nr:hypothetical protein BGZ65_005497 [Modicella reniformis]